jgi:hypothetical protein
VGQTLNDIVNEALSNDFDSSVYKSATQQAVRDALADLARSVDLPSLQGTWTPTVTPGEATLTLPLDDVRILSAFDGESHVELSEVGQDYIDESTPATGRPVVYAVFGQSATLYPTPDRSYPLTFRYSRNMAQVVDTTDLSAFVPDEYLNMLVSFARHRLFRLEDDTTMSQFWRAEYDRDKLRLKADVQRGDRNRVRQVPGPYATARSTPRFMRP